MSLTALQDHIAVPFRTIRLGTLRTFPVKFKGPLPQLPSMNKDITEHEPLVFNTKGMKFIIRLIPDGKDEIVIKISARRIQFAQAFLGRGCPVIWVTPDKVCAARIRDLCNMKNRLGPYLDPDSEAPAEREICIVSSQDPLPYTVGHCMQRIFQTFAKNRGIKFERFFAQMQQKENNEKLVRFTHFIESMDNRRYGLVSSSSDSRKQSHSKRGILKKVESESSSDDFSDYDVDETGILTDDANDSEFKVSSKAKQDISSGNMNTRNTNKKSPSNDRMNETNFSLDKRKDSQQEKRKEMVEKNVVVGDKMKDTSLLKKGDLINDKNTNTTSPVPRSSPSVNDPPRKVHRARKSIPNRHRAVSIESQLRARIEEQTPKALPDKLESFSKTDQTFSSNASSKRKHSEDSDGSDVSGRPSGGESPSLEPSNDNKKKRPKDPFLWAGRKKKKLTLSRSVSPVIDSTESLSNGSRNGNVSSSLDSASSKPLRLVDRKSQAVNHHMKTLRQDAFSQLAPLCTCVVKSPHNLKLSNTERAKCMGMDHIDGRLYGCYNDILQPDMFRPSNKVPVLGLCEEHRERMIRHECCPGCGTFCTGGIFLVCIKNPECPHRFHRDCMILSGRQGDCPHCGSDLSEVKEVNITPGNDGDLTWILAGHNPEKMRLKQYVEERGKSARMGHKPTVFLVPERIPGITETLPNGVMIDTTGLLPGVERRQLEEVLSSAHSDTPKKNRFQPKLFLQYVNENDLSKVVQMLGDGFDCSLHKSTLDTALLEAVPDGDLAIVHLLLQAGADINVRYENGGTPLFRALSSKNKKLIFHLLINKADTTIMDEEGMTCFHRAAMDGYIDGCHLLLTYGRVKINARSEGGYTPIMWAAEHKQATMAKYLLHYGADVSLVDNEGNICLQWAALSGNVDILCLCLQHNSDPNHCNTHGDTALHIAAREDNQNCISLLLAYGADSTIRNKEKDTALECAPAKNSSWMMIKVNEWIRKIGMVNHKVLPLNRERVLCKDMSRGYDNVPIVCVNSVDNARCPTDPPNGFHYVTENVHTSPNTKINLVVAADQSCRCIDGCKSLSCQCGEISEGCWYSKEGTLLPNFDFLEPPLLFECHKMCKCTKSCSNRVVQNGIKYRLQVYRTIGMGWGLRALETIPRGAFVCDYVGELISDAEADLREDDSYLFDLENKDGEMYCIDARNYGNVSRFINHLCKPNLVPVRVFVDHHDIRFPKLAYFTSKEIKPYEELGFDYGDRFWDVKCRQFTCQCGSPECKYSAEAYRKRAQKENEEKNGNTETESDDRTSGEKEK